MEKTQIKDFTKGNIAKQLLWFTLPFMASNALQVLYSTIDMMVGVTKDYKVSGVKVISNSETAGLGAKCTDDTFRAQYKGKDDTVKVIKNGKEI